MATAIARTIARARVEDLRARVRDGRKVKWQRLALGFSRHLEEQACCLGSIIDVDGLRYSLWYDDGSYIAARHNAGFFVTHWVEVELTNELSELFDAKDMRPKWCDVCQSKVLDVPGETTCWRCQQEQRRVGVA